MFDSLVHSFHPTLVNCVSMYRLFIEKCSDLQHWPLSQKPAIVAHIYQDRAREVKFGIRFLHEMTHFDRGNK